MKLSKTLAPRFSKKKYNINKLVPYLKANLNCTLAIKELLEK